MIHSPSQRELFEAALKIAPAERAAWLLEHCADECERAAVERLLDADASDAQHSFDGGVDGLLDLVGEADLATPADGLRFGDFVLGEKLGEGGSSIVFRASREQAGVRQHVALKLLRRNLYTAAEQRRFRDERRALSQLDHPGIARLIEGGVTDAGTPFIALELIDGKSILDFARDGALDLPARLRLMIAVCRAVEAAHRALIVHRDLKPSNVLVTADGIVKLLDFGIAKWLDQSSDHDGTRTEHKAMTPAYAAPEQFSGGQITTATDVYALGILLSELITGKRRERGDSHTPSSRVMDIPAEALPAPAATLRRDLRGDLDNIVLKATAAEPDARYVSAGAFADDIGRHLASEPVLAHPPSTIYRAQKFIARHRGGVVTTALFLLAIVAALGIAIWQADAARKEARRADAIRDFVVGLLRKTTPDRAAKSRPDVPTLVYTAASSLPEGLGGQPEVRAELLYTLGDVLRDMRDTEHSEALLREAEKAGANLPESSPIHIATQVGLTRTLIRKGDYEEAQAHLAPLLALPAAKLPDDMPRAMLLKIEMVIADGRTDWVSAVAHGREMLAAFQHDCHADRPCPTLSSAMHDLASVLVDADLIVEAGALAEETLQRRQREGATPSALANTLALQAKIALYRGDLGMAEAKARKADELLDSLGNGLAKKSLEPLEIRAEARLIGNAAVDAQTQLAVILQQQRAQDASACDLGWIEFSLARIDLLLGHPREAATHAATALDDARDCHVDRNRISSVALAEVVHARALAANGATAAAEAAYERSHANLAQIRSSNTLFWPLFLVESMRLARVLGHPDSAARDAHDLLAALDRGGALPTHPWRIEAKGP